LRKNDKSLPLWGRWHGEAVTDEGGGTPQIAHNRQYVQISHRTPSLIRQKSKIFASFPPGEAFETRPKEKGGNPHV